MMPIAKTFLNTSAFLILTLCAIPAQVDTLSSADVALQLRVAEWGPLPAAGRVSVILGMPRPKAMRRIWWGGRRDVDEVMEVRLMTSAIMDDVSIISWIDNR